MVGSWVGVLEVNFYQHLVNLFFDRPSATLARENRSLQYELDGVSLFLYSYKWIRNMGINHFSPALA